MTVRIISEILEQAKALLDNLQNQVNTFIRSLTPGQVNLQYVRHISSEEERIRRVYRNRW
jgi:hypothetical protein